MRRSTLAVLMVAALVATAASCGGESSSPAASTASSALSVPVETIGDDAGAVQVDGHDLHLDCVGTGRPTVILQSGFGDSGDIWSLTATDSPAVQPGLASSNRVCSYDRPGSMITTTIAADGTVSTAEALEPGRSGPAPTTPDPAEVVEELHDLLAAADVPGPYVLVGHSLGGVLQLLYARTYPDEVSALVIVDSPLPPLRGLVDPQQWEKISVVAIPPEAIPGYALESYDLDTLFDEIEAAGTLPDIPVVVIRRGDGAAFSDDDTVPEGAPFTQAEVDALNNAQWEAQAQWAAGVPGAEVITVPDTTHYVQNQRPDAVVDAIRQVAGGT